MNSEFNLSRVIDVERFQKAISLFDRANEADPNVEIDNGMAHPKELLYAKRLSEALLRLYPDSSEELQLAARCQHICRWEIPRSAYPKDKPGYLRWRTELKKFHARKASEILAICGYPPATVDRVQGLNLKQNFPADVETQMLEDALCIVFLQFQLAQLTQSLGEEKLINALQKSWNKMSPVARECALRLKLGESETLLIGKALGP